MDNFQSEELEAPQTSVQYTPLPNEAPWQVLAPDEDISIDCQLAAVLMDVPAHVGLLQTATYAGVAQLGWPAHVDDAASLPRLPKVVVGQQNPVSVLRHSLLLPEHTE